MFFLYWNFCTELHWFCLTDWVAATSCNIMRLIWPQPTRSNWKVFSKLQNVFVHMLAIILSNMQFEANTFILMIVWWTLPVTQVKNIYRPTSTPDLLAVKISDYLRSDWPKAAARTETDIQPARSNTPEQGRTQTASLKALPKMDTPERSLPLRVHKVWCA